jgi:nitrous oxide reductase
MGNTFSFALSLLSSLLAPAAAAGAAAAGGAASIWELRKEAVAMAASAAGNHAYDREDEDAVDAAYVVWSGGRAVE